MKSIVKSLRDKLAQAIEEKTDFQDQLETLQETHENIKDVTGLIRVCAAVFFAHFFFVIRNWPLKRKRTKNSTPHCKFSKSKMIFSRGKMKNSRKPFRA
jgi:hypothetical protein